MLFMRSFVVAVFLAYAALVGFCGGHKVQLTSAPSQPAAMGAVQVGHDKNGNTTVDLNVNHLAQPANLTPPKSAYVVWLQASGKQPENKGELRVGKNLKGELKFTTTEQNFDLFVTPEDGPTVTAPAGEKILSNHVQR